jgi:type II secretory pathway component PulC
MSRAMTVGPVVVVATAVILLGDAASAPAQSNLISNPDLSAEAGRPDADRAVLARSSDLAVAGIILRDGEDPIAILEDVKTKKQNVYKVGAGIRGGRITEITPEKVTIRFADGEVELRLSATAPGGPLVPPVSGGGPAALPSVAPAPAPARQSPFPHVQRATLENLLRSPDLITQVTPVDHGVRIGEVHRDSVFEALGLRSGDVIRMINEHIPGSTMPLSQAVEQAVQRGGMLRIYVERNGRSDMQYIQVQP